VTDPYDLQRFVEAQAPVYERACAELRSGNKTSHWMWFVFPQLKGMGRSSMAWHYGIASKDEALAYWRHPLLGERLKECTALALGVQGRSVHEIFHSPDNLKFRSCMTLFAQVVPEEPLFAQALDRFFGGTGDEATLALLSPDSTGE